MAMVSGLFCETLVMNDLDLYDGGGELAPYSQPLAPAPDFNTSLTNREIDEYQQYTGGGQMILGQPLPTGISLAQATEHYQQLGNVFVADFIKLGHNVSQTQKAVKWLLDALTNPPKTTQKRHSYNLFEHTSDPIFQAFANYAHDQRFSAKFVQDACWWVTEAGRRLAAQQVGTPAQGSAPSLTDPTDSLNDAQFEAVVKKNDAAKASTMGYLKDLWQDSFESNLRMVDNYLTSLPLREQQALDVFTTGWIKSLNTKEVVLGLYRQAIGQHSIPSGGALSSEIAECERVMRTNRKQWMSDERLQARYRELLRIRDGG